MGKTQRQKEDSLGENAGCEPGQHRGGVGAGKRPGGCHNSCKRIPTSSSHQVIITIMHYWFPLDRSFLCLRKSTHVTLCMIDCIQDFVDANLVCGKVKM